MKKLLFFSILYLLFQALSAQPEDKKLGKITFLMVDGEYEEAVKKTEKLREDSEYRKNGWMYYYMSQAYFEIAGMPELAEDYPKALKNSIKAAYKLAKYRDKSNENLKVWQDAQGFISVLKDSVITVSEIYYHT
jgi:tetratricopeptide (TPR) repeat protein